MDEMRRIIAPQGLDATNRRFILPRAFLLPGREEGVRVGRGQGGRLHGITVHNGDGGGGVARGARLAIRLEARVERGDEVRPDQPVEGLPAVY